ncbi:MAG: hypothetical protein FD180_2957 [Planctomycetota bacterium]|nr:MAG: hypothetical protein FD180_2957 [Planctomycetota bacterium]
MRTTLAAVALVLSAAAASAEESVEKMREFVRQFDKGSGDGEFDGTRQLLLKRPGIGSEWVKVSSTVLLSEVPRRRLAWIGATLFRNSESDLVEPLRTLLAGTEAGILEYGVELAFYAKQTDALAPELIGLLERQEGVVFSVKEFYRDLKNPKAIQSLLETTLKGGYRGSIAFDILCSVQVQEARAYLRKVALDTKEDAGRRSRAVMGLTPFLGDEDRRVLGDCLKDPDLGVAIDAAQELNLEKSAAEPDVLHALRDRIEKEIAGPAVAPNIAENYERGLLHVDCLLTAEGDLDALKNTLRRAKASGNWRTWAAVFRSRRPERIALLLEAAKEEDPGARFEILRGLTETVQAADLPRIQAQLRKGDALAFGAGLGDRLWISSRDSEAMMEIAIGLEDEPSKALDALVYGWLRARPETEDVRGIEALGAIIRLLEKHRKNPRERKVIAATLRSRLREEIGDSEKDVGRWRAWFDELAHKRRQE